MKLDGRSVDKRGEADRMGGGLVQFDYQTGDSYQRLHTLIYSYNEDGR